MNRLKSWLGADELEPPIDTTSSEAVRLACDESGQWRGRALFVYENDGWTVFDDLSGALGWVPAHRWLEFACVDDMVFASYNDAIHIGELVIIENGIVVCEFRYDEDDPSENVNKGQPPANVGGTLETWVDAASFVDEDQIAYSKTGQLWILKPAG